MRLTVIIEPTRTEEVEISRVPCVGEFLILEDENWYKVTKVAHVPHPAAVKASADWIFAEVHAVLMNGREIDAHVG